MFSNPQSWRSRRWVRLSAGCGLVVLRVGLGGIFIKAGIAKILDRGAFAQSVAAYGLLPGDWVTPFATALPWLEAILGLALVCGLWTRVNALGCAVLLTVFALATAGSMALGRTISCGCFGAAAHGGTGWEIIARDLGMLVAAVIVAWAGKSIPGGIDRLLSGPRGEIDPPRYQGERDALAATRGEVQIG